MELNEEQKKTVKSWVADGDSLSDIQKKLSSEFDMSMTYMDVRFLVIDLGVDVQDKPEEKKPKQDAQDDLSAQPDDGTVQVEVDRVTTPGSLVSGSVVFSDGVSATWSLDQMGRLALDAGDPEYRPSEEDLHSFQEELKATLSTRGF